MRVQVEIERVDDGCGVPHYYATARPVSSGFRVRVEELGYGRLEVCGMFTKTGHFDLAPPESLAH